MTKISQKAKRSPGNLPVSLSSFIGREREIGEVKRLVSSHRLVTLTGAGGSGKTRLALRVAEALLEEFSDGIWFVEFTSIVDPQLVPQTVASALNIHPVAGQPLLNVLLNHLSTWQALLIFDNCEHLVSACAV